MERKNEYSQTKESTYGTPHLPRRRSGRNGDRPGFSAHPALVTACVDVVLEAVSCWLGLPAAHVPYALVALFSAALLIPGAVCFARLLQMRSSPRPA